MRSVHDLPPGSGRRLPPKAAGDMADNLGLVYTIAKRAFDGLQREEVRPRHPDELVAEAAIVMMYFISTHNPERGRLSTYCLKFAPSFVMRAWRRLDIGMTKSEACRNKNATRHRRILTCRGRQEELEMEEARDRTPDPLDALIAREEAELNREMAREWMEDVPGLEMMVLRQRILGTQAARGLGISTKLLWHREQKVRAEVRARTLPKRQCEEVES